MASKIQQELNQLAMLRGFDVVPLTFDSPECRKYRQQALSTYLLRPEASIYPSFVTNRELSSAFANQTEITLCVDLSGYIDPENTDFLGGRTLRVEADQLILEEVVSLFSSAEEVIEQLHATLRKYFDLAVTPLSKAHSFRLKVRGKNDYLKSEYPLLASTEVRLALREQESLALTLTEVPTDESTSFPPQVDWDSPLEPLEGSLFFWYPPVPLDEVMTYSPPQKVPPVPSIPKLREQSLKSLLRGRNVEPQLFSGECEWPFRVKVCGIEHLFTLYQQAFSVSATDAGVTTPQFFVLPTKKDKAKRRDVQSARSRRCSVPVLASKNGTAFKHASRMTDKTAASSSHINHGPANKVADSLAGHFQLPFVPYVFSFEFALVYGGSVLKKSHCHLKYFPFQYYTRFYQTIQFPLRVSELPREVRLGVNVYTASQQGDSIIIGCASMPLFDEQGRMATGLQTLNLWPFYRLEQRLACMGSYWGKHIELDVDQPQYCKIYIQFDSYVASPLIYSLKEHHAPETLKNRLSGRFRRLSYSQGLSAVDDSDTNDFNLLQASPTIEEIASLERLLRIDPLKSLSKEEKRKLFVCRYHYKSQSLALQLFLTSVDWSRPLQVKEAHKMLGLWAPLHPEDALALLNADFSDEQVRTYATKRIASLCDEDLALYMPQLAQALSFSASHVNLLAEFLIERALMNPYVVGHELFWCFRSQLHFKATAERFGLVLEQFLMLCGRYKQVLLRELEATSFLYQLGMDIKQIEKTRRTDMLRELLAENKHRLPDCFILPVDSRLQVRGVTIERCKVMDSKKVPLFVFLDSSERKTPSIPIIYKIGDDLQQDILSIQLIKLMDSIWLENGLNLKMKTYRVVATSDQAGMIEAVRNSTTMAEIHGGVLGALAKASVHEYLRSHSVVSPEESLDNFVRSCAGFCVATFVLGIGDRHSGNIMITTSGHLFHIDFGHFLGNFKKKAGINRERSKFVFTEEMIYVMGGRESQEFTLFTDYCCRAYNLIRKHGKRFINLFRLMVSAGIPELRSDEDIHYLRERLALKLTEMEARDLFAKEIHSALNNVMRRFDNAFRLAIRKTKEEAPKKSVVNLDTSG